ncbi:MAG TPA: prepilin peptidase [Candidatus Ozemobacteraceae bacterium]|nr:prepilin peptidase [Candidatus Ozemobacteraceae bacterium]HQG28577.1 prepilin peptidase [Candidatus Ozemobacteraceae bacterium]
MPEITHAAPDLLFPFLTFFFALFGSLLGSFSNVVILRMAEGRSVVFPPSSCPHCKHQLSPLDLIPVFGWLLLLGKCRYCKAPISWQYPLVEASAAAIVGSTFAANGLNAAFVVGAAWSMIWFIVSILHLRRECTAPAPFLWPLAYRLALGYAVAPIQPLVWAAALGGGAVMGAIMRYRHPASSAVAWFGITVVNLLSTQKLGMGYLAALPIILVLAARSDESAVRQSTYAMFVWNVAGIAACAWSGNPGW